MAKRKIRIRSGEMEAWMEVTEEEYQSYYRPWWQQKKREQRNREAMEEWGYREESYEEWKENDMRTELFAESMEELMEKKVLLDMLQEALESLMPEEKELAVKVFGEEMSVYEFARINGGSRRTLDFRKNKVLEKLRSFFRERGVEV